MVIFDTNAVLRYVLQDNLEMADAVEKELSSNDCLIPVEVIAEMVYVLNKVYKIERTLITKIINGVVNIDENLVVDFEVVLHACFVYASTKLDFIDCLLAGYSQIRGYDVFTFDKELKTYIQ
jgi:predicted nucleic-acid-binding protein